MFSKIVRIVWFVLGILGPITNHPISIPTLNNREFIPTAPQTHESSRVIIGAGRLLLLLLLVCGIVASVCVGVVVVVVDMMACTTTTTTTTMVRIPHRPSINLIEILVVGRFAEVNGLDGEVEVVGVEWNDTTSHQTVLLYACENRTAADILINGHCGWYYCREERWGPFGAPVVDEGKGEWFDTCAWDLQQRQQIFNLRAFRAQFARRWGRYRIGASAIMGWVLGCWVEGCGCCWSCWCCCWCCCGEINVKLSLLLLLLLEMTIIIIITTSIIIWNIGTVGTPWGDYRPGG